MGFERGRKRVNLKGSRRGEVERRLGCVDWARLDIRRNLSLEHSESQIIIRRPQEERKGKKK